MGKGPPGQDSPTARAVFISRRKERQGVLIPWRSSLLKSSSAECQTNSSDIRSHYFIF